MLALLHITNNSPFCLKDHCWHTWTVFPQVRKQMSLTLPSLWRTGPLCFLARGAATHPGGFLRAVAALAPAHHSRLILALHPSRPGGSPLAFARLLEHPSSSPPFLPLRLASRPVRSFRSQARCHPRHDTSPFHTPFFLC